LVVDELADLGIRAAPEQGGAAWDATIEEVWRANLHLRIASRVLVRVARFRARSFIELERHARRIEWARYLASGTSASLRVTSRKSKLYHEGAISERFTRWITEATGSAAVRLAAVDEADDEVTDGGSQLFVVRVLRDECIVSVDSSGELLHRRGYRQAVARAPMRENLAAALLRAADWAGDVPLLDPLCGSGTIPVEAALIARRIPPGLARADRQPRSFAFERWPGFDGSAWKRIVEEARAAILPASPVGIAGSDRDTGAIDAARANADRAGVPGDVVFEVRALSAAEPPADQAGRAGLVAVNPPYGVRIGEARPLRNLYAALGRLMTERLPGWRLAMVSANEELERQVGRELREAFVTSNGGIRLRSWIG
jgi:putative N6-adenine-specific DNA methylase